MIDLPLVVGVALELHIPDETVLCVPVADPWSQPKVWLVFGLLNGHIDEVGTVPSPPGRGVISWIRC